MEFDFEEFIIKRCEKALTENEEYVKSERDELLTQDELQAIAEKLCYRKGFSDAMAINKYSQ